MNEIGSVGRRQVVPVLHLVGFRGNGNEGEVWGSRVPPLQEEHEGARVLHHGA